jgi:hypothetical protein
MLSPAGTDSGAGAAGVASAGLLYSVAVASTEVVVSAFLPLFLKILLKRFLISSIALGAELR